MPGDAADRLRAEPFTRGASSAEKNAVLPTLTTEYKAAGTPESGELSRLVLVMGKDGFKPGGTAYFFIQYVHLSLGEFSFTPTGQRCRFLIADVQPKLLTLDGRNLLRTCDQIALRRIPWLRLADRDFRPGDDADASEPIILGLELTDWKRPASQAAELAATLEPHEEMD